MASPNDIHYQKLRAIAWWAFQTLLHCVFACSIVMTIIQLANQYVDVITFPVRRIPLTHILITVFIIILRSFDLIGVLEKIDKSQPSQKEDFCGKDDFQKIDDYQRCRSYSNQPHPQPQDHSEFLLQKKYQHSKTRIVVLYTCSGVVMFAALTSMFFFLFVYDFSLFKNNRPPLLDQILFPIMIGGVVTLFNVKAASLRIESLEKKLFSRPEKKGSETIPVETSSTVLADFNFPSEIVDDNAHLKVSMACFVRHCVENNLFEPYTKRAWSPVDGMLYDKNNHPISAKQLAQSFQDQLTKGSLAE